MQNSDFVFITDVGDQVVDPQKRSLQKVFHCKRFNGIKDVSIKIPTKHPCVMSVFKINLTVKKLVDETIIAKERIPSRNEGRSIGRQIFHKI